jgi:hypothetical protein
MARTRRNKQLECCMMANDDDDDDVLVVFLEGAG